MGYPSSVWDGDTDARSPGDYRGPNAVDWNKIVAEVIATQTELETVKDGHTFTDKCAIGVNDWGVGATGIELDGTDEDMVWEVIAAVNAAVPDGAYAASYNQLAVTITQTHNVSTFASWNELYLTGDQSTNGDNAAVWGHVEISGTVVGPGSTSTYLGSVVGSFLAPATFTNSGICGAFIADSLLTTGFTNNAVLAAFVAHVNASHPTKANWPVAFYIDGADVALGFGSETDYEDGIKAVPGAAPSGTVTHFVKVKVGASTYAYVPCYSADTVS